MPSPKSCFGELPIRSERSKEWLSSTINVIIDGTPHAMIVKLVEDGDYTNGEIYGYTTTGAVLGEGTHTYQFTASDGIDSVTGDTGIHSGPALPAAPATEIPTLSPIGLIALVCVLSVIVVISVHVRKRRGTQLLIAAVPVLMPVGTFFLF